MERRNGPGPSDKTFRGGEREEKASKGKGKGIKTGENNLFHREEAGKGTGKKW